MTLNIETQDAKVRNAIQILHAHKATETGNEYGTQRARKCFASEGSIAVGLCQCGGRQYARSAQLSVCWHPKVPLVRCLQRERFA